MYTALKQDGVLVTYAAKGSVRRAMQAVGFTVERLPAPPEKEKCYGPPKLQTDKNICVVFTKYMLRATKTAS